MYRYTVIAVGKMKNRALADLSDDFSKRLKRSGNFELIELKDGDIESESINRPRQVHIFGVASSPRRDYRNIIEGIASRGAFGQTNLYFIHDQ